MSPPVVEKVIAVSAKEAGLAIDEKEDAPIIVSWARQAYSREMMMSADEDAGNDVHLLYVQALLWDIYQEWHRDTGRADSLSAVWLKRHFAAKYSAREDHEPDGGDLVMGAVSSYIDAQLPQVDEQAKDFMLPDSAPPSQLVRRQAVKMAGAFSSPTGFKRHAHARELVWDTVCDELGKLAAGSFGRAEMAAMENLIKQGRAAANGSRFVEIEARYDAFEGKLCEMVRDKGTGGREHFMRSGMSYNAKKTLGQTAVWLVRAAYEALEKLAQSRTNILKKTESEGRTVYELVHDGLGTPLVRWGRIQQAQVDYTLAAVIAAQGENFPWRELKSDHGRKEIRGRCWKGCNLHAVRINAIDFRDCDFRGCVFTDCILEDCKFDDCNLSGTVFQRLASIGLGGTKLDPQPNAWMRVMLDNCRCESLLCLGTTWTAVSVERSHCDNVSLRPQLHGLTLSDCSMRFSQILGLTTEDWTKIDATNCQFSNSLMEDISPSTMRRFRNQGCRLGGVLPIDVDRFHS
jgi:uncharacterized protein YjbI with pentapeptide repeats